MESRAQTNFIVTTSAKGASRRQIWKPDEPLKIGFPMQWLMESTSEGVRITYLGGKAGESSKNRVREISFSELKKNPQIQLSGDAPKTRGGADSQIDLRIEPASQTAPVFAQVAGPPSQSEGDHVLGIYKTLGPSANWVTEANRLEKVFTAKLGSTQVYSIKRTSGGEFHIIPHVAGLMLMRSKGQPRTEIEGKEGLKLTAAEISTAVLAYRSPSSGTISWRFGWIIANPGNLTRGKVERLPTLDLGVDTEAAEFRKQVRNVSIALIALLALSLVWPKPQPKEELIPPQLAKIIFTPPKHMAAAQASGAPAVRTAAQKKVQQTAVVQAFRAKALQSAVSSLMKGGMTRLLAQSDFISGHRQNAELGRILNSQSKDLRDLSPEIGGLATRNLAVASLGGDSVGGKGKVGYGKGERASVTGQGKAFVSMDIADSQVDDGLTKDQVGEVIHRHMSEIRYCYESAMIRMPDIEGKLVVDFVIGGNGIVKTADAKESTLPDPRLDDCILRRLSSWKFPNPRGGVDVAVTYPFIFKTLGR